MKNAPEPLPETVGITAVGADVGGTLQPTGIEMYREKRIVKDDGQSGWYHGTYTASSLFIYRGRGFFYFFNAYNFHGGIPMKKRTIYCGELSEALVGTTQTACGWVQTKRDMGGVIFIDLRDREGELQAVFDAQNLSAEDFKTAEGLKNQSVIAITGLVRLRGEDTVNPKIKTGTVEIASQSIEVLSVADTMPFKLDETVREDLRLQYRYLDIRRPEMLRNLRFRHKVASVARHYLDENGFIDVETPYLTRSTPEGARDYLVPSRVHPGMFYALPQSPQIFKQLLMVGGIDKYYQVARCFRDEDLRADRQPEFTQVDMEMSFVEQEDVLVHLEKMFKYMFKETIGLEITDPFPRITWNDSMDKYGCDKPDLRFGLEIKDVTDIAAKTGFEVFNKVTKAGGVVRAINAKNAGDFFTRSRIEELTEKAVNYGAKGMAWILIRPDGSYYTVLDKFMSKEDLESIVKALDGSANDFIFFCADKLQNVRKILGALRNDVGDMLGLRKKGEFKPCFVIDFPEFEYSEEEKRYVATHHPFTMPYPEDLQYLKTAPEKVRAQAYDVVLNGVELGSGSVRIHDRNVQETMFEALGFTEEETMKRFGFMVNAFRYGTPPHAGFAFGLDRFVMLLLGCDSLRDVIAFPKIKDASCLMTDAPNLVETKQLEELSLLSLSEQTETLSVQRKKKSTPKIDVDNVASLAKLCFADDEKKSLEKDMESIIAFANQLDELDVSGVSAREHLVSETNVFAPDVPQNSFDRTELLANAKTKTSEYITVPRIVE